MRRSKMENDDFYYWLESKKEWEESEEGQEWFESMVPEIKKNENNTKIGIGLRIRLKTKNKRKTPREWLREDLHIDWIYEEYNISKKVS